MDRWLKCGSLKRDRPTDEEGENTFNVKVKKSMTLEPNLSVSIEPNSSASLKPNSAKISAAKIRKYNSDYLEMGFTFTGPEQQPKPQCVICYESLSNECMKPAKLRRHLETKHPEYKSKSLDFFKNKLGELRRSRKNITKHYGANVNENATLASYERSRQYHTATADTNQSQVEGNRGSIILLQKNFHQADGEKLTLKKERKKQKKNVETWDTTI
ncbi:unnamed protein product [Diabrotica balteata]|uniref:Zinc finger BED domain-containing protein 5 n=1 Tax=Diabrotica balteata TaxID=107213 RepID=A0A9N9SU63_DIABA|nr:unnamed protein product [Diabrotica balteata]